MTKHTGSLLLGQNRKLLRRWLALFFLALALPSIVLIQQALTRLDLETFHQHRSLAEELVARIDMRFQQFLGEEEKRAFTDYAFLNIAGDPAVSFLQRSPLSSYPPDSAIPGVIGYFQVDAQGLLQTPLLPYPPQTANSYGISTQEFQQRLALQKRIRQVLADNRLLSSSRRTQASSIVTATVNQQPTVDKHDQKTSQQLTAAEDDQHAREIKSIALGNQADLSALDSVKRAFESEKQDQLAIQETTIPGQSGFDQLNQASLGKKSAKQTAGKSLGRVTDLKLDNRYQVRQEPVAQTPLHSRQQAKLKLEKRARKELNTLPEPILKDQIESVDSLTQDASLPASKPSADRSDAIQAQAQSSAPVRIRTFESEIDPFEFSLLDNHHFVLYRKVWRKQQRFIQGILVNQQDFLRGMIEATFQPSVLASISNLLVAYRGDVYSIYNGQSADSYFSSTHDLQGALLYQDHLSAPFNELGLIFSLNQLPATTGSYVIGWTAAWLFLILCSGLYLIYRVIIKQIELTSQQQNFVSAVSHELKTPLTSIRMYSEMLREGWASEQKQRHYYNYIFDESERLSRLINNVLQLAHMSHRDQQGDMRIHSVAELLDIIRSKVTTQTEHAGFILNLQNEVATRQITIQVDPDWFAQIIINLVDNAVKFSAKANNKTIDIDCKQTTDNSIRFSIRDYGPGIPKQHIKKIFNLFYRTENELTRETVGTGIGLALVRQLSEAMQGQLEVVNCSPGVEFRVYFPVDHSDNSS